MSKAWLFFGAAILFLVLALTFSSVVFGVFGVGCGAIGFYLLKQEEYDIKPEDTGGRSIFVEPAPFLPKTQNLGSSGVIGGNPLSLTHNSERGSTYSPPVDRRRKSPEGEITGNRDTAEYRVFPKEADLKPLSFFDSIPLSEWEKKDIKGLSSGGGFLLALLVFGGIFALGTSARIDSGSLVVLAGIAAAVVLIVVHRSIIAAKTSEKERSKAEQERRSVDSANKAAVIQAENEARYLTTDLINTYQSSVGIAGELPQCLSRATSCLEQAEKEYKDNAFAPFWDAVEHAAQQMAVFHDKAKQVSTLADKYYRGLNSRKHTFPSFPVNSGRLPNPSSAVNELRRLFRMGQTNYQFWSIWEHRQTREVMIAGFRNLGDAVNSLGSTIDNALYGLEQSISSDTARMVQEEIKTRDALDKRMLEQNRMLDNIQHHRKPGILDTPSRY